MGPKEARASKGRVCTETRTAGIFIQTAFEAIRPLEKLVFRGYNGFKCSLIEVLAPVHQTETHPSHANKQRGSTVSPNAPQVIKFFADPAVLTPPIFVIRIIIQGLTQIVPSILPQAIIGFVVWPGGASIALKTVKQEGHGSERQHHDKRRIQTACRGVF